MLRYAKAILLLVATVAAMAAAQPVLADKLILTDGTEVEGQVNRSGDRYGVITDEGLKWFDANQVDRVELDPLKTVDSETRATFMATKAEARRQDTPKEAVSVWQRYIAANNDGPLVAAARDEMARWQQAKAQGLVIWAGRMVTPQEREESQRQAVELIDEGMRLYREGSHGDARRKLDQADRLWPDHPTVDFYGALVLRHLRQPMSAVRRLLDVLDEMPQHVPTLSNAACICTQITDYRSAVHLLARALRRDPENETLLDNAWEVMHMIEVEKQGPVVRMDLARMMPDDVKVINEALGAQKNRHALDDQYRWGSEWVTRMTLERHLAERKDTRERLDTMQVDLKRLQAQIDALDREIEVSQKIREGSLQAGNVNGALLVQRKIRDLMDQRQDLVNDQNRLKARAVEMIREMPQPTWTGRVELLGVESPLEKIESGPPPAEAIRKALLTGQVRIVGGDGQMLGRASVEPHHPRSIWNPLGPHGSPYSPESLFDLSSRYGRLLSYLSCRDPEARQPPRLMLGDELVAYLTTNESFTPHITLEQLIGVLRRQK